MRLTIPYVEMATVRVRYVPSGSFTSLWFVYVPQGQIKGKYSETGRAVYCPYPRRLESLTVYRCHCKGSAFSSIILRP